MPGSNQALFPGEKFFEDIRRHQADEQRSVRALQERHALMIRLSPLIIPGSKNRIYGGGLCADNLRGGKPLTFGLPL